MILFSLKNLYLGAGNFVSFHPNNVSVAVAMNSGSVRIYDIRALKLQQHYILHDNTKCVSWHPYANYLLTCGADGNLRIVDVMEGRPLYTLSAHEKPVECVAFSKDGYYFASGSQDKLVQVELSNYNLNSCSAYNNFLGVENEFYISKRFAWFIKHLARLIR